MNPNIKFTTNTDEILGKVDDIKKKSDEVNFDKAAVSAQEFAQEVAVSLQSLIEQSVMVDKTVQTWRDVANEIMNSGTYMQSLNNALDNMNSKDVGHMYSYLNQELREVRSQINDINSEPSITAIDIQELEKLEETQSRIEQILQHMRDAQNTRVTLEELTETAAQSEPILDSLVSKMKELGFASKSANISAPLTKGTISAKRLIMSLIGVQSTYSLISRASRQYRQANDEMNQAMNQVMSTLASGLAPLFQVTTKILQVLASTVYMVTAAFLSLINSLFGTNYQMKMTNVGAKNTGKSMRKLGKSGKKAGKDIKKAFDGAVSSIDVLNVLTDKSLDEFDDPASGLGNIGGGGGVDIPPIKAPDTSAIEAVFARLQKLIQPFIDTMKSIDFQPLIDAASYAGDAIMDTLSILGLAFLDVLNFGVAPLIKILTEEVVPTALYVIGDALNLMNPLLARLLDDYIVPFFNWFLVELVPVALYVLIGAFELLVAVVAKVWEGFLDWWDWMSPFAAWLGDKFVGVLEKITEKMGIMTDKVNENEDGWGDLFKGLGFVIGILTTAALVIGTVSTVSKVLTGVLGILKGAWTILSAIVGVVAKLFTGALAVSFSAIIALVILLGTMLLGIITNFEQVKVDIMKIVENIKGIFKGLVNFIVGVVTLDFKRAFGGLADVVKNAFAGIARIVIFPFNTIIDGVNAMIRGLNKVKVPKWVPGVGGKGINIPQVPRIPFADGGVVRGPVDALVGEYIGARNNPEVIAPERMLKKYVGEALEEHGGNNIQEMGDIHLTIEVDGKPTVEETISMYNAYKNRGGKLRFKV